MEKAEIKQILKAFTKFINNRYPFEFITEEDIAAYLKKCHKTKVINYQKWFQKENQL